jgi:hypothetical protein
MLELLSDISARYSITFARRSRKASLLDSALCDAVAEMAAGLIDAILGAVCTRSGFPCLVEGSERPLVSGCFQTTNVCRPVGEEWADF